MSASIDLPVLEAFDDRPGNFWRALGMAVLLSAIAWPLIILGIVEALS